MTTYRYTEKLFEEESDHNRNLREMMEMIKREEVSNSNIDFDNLKLNGHSTDRIMELTGCQRNRALHVIKHMLRRAKRIGDQLAFDGRINVLFAYDKHAIYLSPNLEHVVTVHKIRKISYKPVCEVMGKLTKAYKGVELREKLKELHQHAWSAIEEQESEQLGIFLTIEKEASKNIKNLLPLLHHKSKSKEFIDSVKRKIADERYKIKFEGRKLFHMKIEKRHIGKSLVYVI